MVVCYIVYSFFFLQFVTLFRCNWNFFLKNLVFTNKYSIFANKLKLLYITVK